MEGGITLRMNEDGQWVKYEEPYAIIECRNEEDFNFLKEAVEFYKSKGNNKDKVSNEELNREEIEKVIDGLSLIHKVIPNYKMGVYKGLKEYETENIADNAVVEAIKTLEKLI